VERETFVRKLIMCNLVTLDGYFDGERSTDVSWHRYVWGDELERFSLESRSAGTLLFERPTYESMAAHWSRATGEIADLINTIPKIVFSRTIKIAQWNNTQIVTSDPAESVARLKREPGKDLLVFGSATLPAALARRGLIDEYRLGVNPVVLADGNPLFKAKPRHARLQLLDATPSAAGGVVLRYVPQDDALRDYLRPAPNRTPRKFTSRKKSALDGPFVETKEWSCFAASEPQGDAANRANASRLM